MITIPKVLRLLTIAAAAFLGTAASRAGLGGIQDNGAFFSEQARAEGSRIIGDVERTLKKDIVVETFKEAPENTKNGANLADKTAANQFFQQWAEKQAQQQSVNGIYILLVKQPSHLQVVVGNQTLKQAFTASDRDSLVATMLTKLRAKQNDAALLDGLNFAASTMRAHAGVTGHGAPAGRGESRPVAQGSSWGWVLPVVIGAAVLWIVFGLLRSLFGGSANPAGGLQGGGGGGFGRSLLGGLFGAAAGMWMYDQFFGSHSNAAPPMDPGSTGGDSGFSGQDTDYTSSGGGFGDDSGGGSGGGDSGGFGGGDSGGGGDF